MKELVNFELDGKPVYVEVEETDSGEGIIRASRGDDGIRKAETKFTEALARVKPAAEAVLNTFHDINTPDDIQLEFGLKLNATAGAIFASAASEATFKVILKWNNKK